MADKRKKRDPRPWVQGLWTLLSNGYMPGWLRGGLYQGEGKRFCLPGLNCYSCPGALGSCPIGALQSVLGSYKYRFSYYVMGFLIFVGAVLGRFVCGWLCPFGWFQELLHKIPFPHKRHSLPGHRYLRWTKYAVLLVFVILMPLFVTNIVGQGDPAFCKWICPAGTLMGGIPQMLANAAIRAQAGLLFLGKLAILILCLLGSVIVYRPFCKYLCPLGAFYALFSRISLVRMSLDESRCTHCGQCERACRMDVPVLTQINHAECIRCGDCARACPHGCIHCGLRSHKS